MIDGLQRWAPTHPRDVVVWYGMVWHGMAWHGMENKVQNAEVIEKISLQKLELIIKEGRLR